MGKKKNCDLHNYSPRQGIFWDIWEFIIDIISFLVEVLLAWTILAVIVYVILLRMMGKI